MSTILAVDDSATMRRCLEITFAGTEFNVITCASADEALEKVKSLSPVLVIADVSLPPHDGYELCSTIKLAQPRVPVLMLSSKQTPFDAAKGANADGHLDKPFDTQVLQDRARELAKAEGKAAPEPIEERAAPATLPKVAGPAGSMPERVPASNKIPAPRRPTPAMMSTPTPSPAPGPTAPRPTAQQAMRRTVPFAMPGGASRSAQSMVDAARKVGTERSASGTAAGIARPEAKRSLSDTMPGVAEEQRAHESPRPGPVAPPTRPAPEPAAPDARAQVTAAAGTPGRVDGAPVATIPDAQIASLHERLDRLGLTKDQMEGVLALSRDLVEQVVWEVVPVLAETLIKEEIARLTKG